MKAMILCFVLSIACASADHQDEDNGSVHYKFEYRVSDPHTGDEKSQFEHRDGKQVKGGYTLKEADGTTRIVEYESDPHDGFNAVVKRIGHAQHPAHYKNGDHDQCMTNGNNAEEGDKHGGTSYIGITHYGYGH